MQLIVSLLFGVSLLPALGACMMSPMLFDAGESTAAWTMLALVLSYPLLVIISLPLAWILYRRQSYRAALGVSFLPLISVVGIGIMLGMDVVLSP